MTLFIPPQKENFLIMNYILRDENAIYYECGYSCDNALFMKLGSESFFLTDGRYQEDAKENVKDATVISKEIYIKRQIELSENLKLKD